MAAYALSSQRAGFIDGRYWLSWQCWHGLNGGFLGGCRMSFAEERLLLECRRRRIA